tara:strand:- start:1509 stop:2654 length:1146 start_codon:yes stop_codon:yes gene_type:complete
MRYKKILFVTPRYPFPVRGGDKLRISEIMKFLSKKNSLDLISIGKNVENKNFINKQFIFKNNFFNQSIQILKSLINKEPIQIGLYKVPVMKRYIDKISKNYDVIIFHLIRTTYYLPKKYNGKKILEMTDLISKNYETVEKNLSSLNLLKYLYKYEKFSLRKYEKSIFDKFDNIVFVNPKDLKTSPFKSKKKTSIIGNGARVKQNIYFDKKFKNNIIFFGNINSLANRSACIDFIRNYLPYIKKKYPQLEFRIVGNCSLILKIFFYLMGVKVISNIKDLRDVSKNSLAGICNVKIQSGLQNKVLDYTSIGLPIIVNNNSNNFKFLKKTNILVFNNVSQLLVRLNSLTNNRTLRNKISKDNFLKTRKYYDWNKILILYSKLIR